MISLQCYHETIISNNKYDDLFRIYGLGYMGFTACVKGKYFYHRLEFAMINPISSHSLTPYEL